MASLPPGSQATTDKNTSAPIRYLDTTAAYDLWSEVYDTDGNFLQALDTIEMEELLPKFLSQIQTPQPWKLVDMGCGTGRNTMALLNLPRATIVGLDASPKMLDIASKRAEAETKTRAPDRRADSVVFHVYDLLQHLEMPIEAKNADAIISTLVLEHVPIENFFAAASKTLKPGGVLLVTNMHADMGEISQAGFVDPKTGEKIRPTSHAHRIEDVVSGARKHGFEVVGEVSETAVDEQLSAKLGPRAKKWIGVTVWFGVSFCKTHGSR